MESCLEAVFYKRVESLMRFALSLDNGVKTVTFEMHFHLKEEWKSPGAKFDETFLNMVFIDSVHSRHKEYTSLRSTDPVASAECPHSNI